VATTVEMPKLGNTVQECQLTTWLRHKGDSVAAGDVLAEVETDKATFEIVAPADGVLLDTYVDEGAIVPVFTPVCVIGAAGEHVPGDGTRRPGRQEDAEPGGTRTAPVPPGPEPKPAAPVIPAAPSRPVAAKPGAGSPDAALSQAPLSPRARRFAHDHHFQPRPVAGSGPGGRIVEADLRDLYYALPRVSDRAAQEMAIGHTARGTGSGIGGMILGDDLDAPRAPISPMRRLIADRLRESVNSTAQYTLNASANAAGLLAVRRIMKGDPATADITISHLVTFCTIRALLAAPGLNAEFAGGTLRRHAAVHLAFACDTDRGLMAPVVRDSQRLSLPELSIRMRELAGQAADGSISPDDLTGGTFTVSNLGRLGVESFTPILNPPQVAILGVDAIGLKAIRKPDGNIEFIDSIGLSLTLDHQVIDGVPGARSLNVIAREIENVEALCTT
jgi:pyruvate dehydrogenase E2 component (dihydrolipoyllysine-residue acetyltransferase)